MLNFISSLFLFSFSWLLVSFLFSQFFLVLFSFSSSFNCSHFRSRSRHILVSLTSLYIFITQIYQQKQELHILGLQLFLLTPVYVCFSLCLHICPWVYLCLSFCLFFCLSACIFYPCSLDC